MPWPPKQRAAIYLDIKRRKGEKAAKEFMHEHGYGGKAKKKAGGAAKKRKKAKR